MKRESFRPKRTQVPAEGLRTNDWSSMSWSPEQRWQLRRASLFVKNSPNLLFLATSQHARPKTRSEKANLGPWGLEAGDEEGQRVAPGTFQAIHLGTCEPHAGPSVTAQDSVWAEAKAGSVTPALIAPEGGRLGSWIVLRSTAVLSFQRGWWDCRQGLPGAA